jgi:hypothetical protein
MRTALLGHIFRATASRKLNQIFQKSTLSLHANITVDGSLGPYFLPPRLNYAVYRDFLHFVLPELLQNCRSEH